MLENERGFDGIVWSLDGTKFYVAGGAVPAVSPASSLFKGERVRRSLSQSDERLSATGSETAFANAWWR